MKQELDNFFPFQEPTAALILESEKVFWGKGIGSKTANIGELCFNTSQTGYQEILTDPSYAKQIITFTFPHIGIVGVNDLDIESNKIHASGCILNQDFNHQSNWRSNNKLDFFLNKNNIPCISNIDTRQLTRLLATKGAIKAAIVHFEDNNRSLISLQKQLKNWSGLKNLDLASVVSTSKSYSTLEGVWNIQNNKYKKNAQHKYHITCLDFGIKKIFLEI